MTLWSTQWHLGFLPVSFIPSRINIHPCVSTTLSRTDERNLGILKKKQYCFGNWGEKNTVIFNSQGIHVCSQLRMRGSLAFLKTLHVFCSLIKLKCILRNLSGDEMQIYCI